MTKECRGQRGGGESRTYKGKQYPLGALMEAMGKVKYASLDLAKVRTYEIAPTLK